MRLPTQELSRRAISHRFLKRNENEPRPSGKTQEIKDENVIVFKKNGEIRQNKHLIEQDKMLKELRNKGYRARFVIGYDQAIFEIQQYLGEPKHKKVEF